MTLTELFNLLKATGYPVAYSHFIETTTSPLPKAPFITYLVAYSTNSFADNKVYQKISNVQVELYTTKKDVAAELKLETILDTNDIPYETTETFIETEKLFQKIYEVRF